MAWFRILVQNRKYSTKTSAIRLWKIILNFCILYSLIIGFCNMSTHHIFQYISEFLSCNENLVIKQTCDFVQSQNCCPLLSIFLIVNKNLPNSWARALCLSYKWTLLTPRSCYLNTELWLVSWLSLVDNTDLSLVQKSLVHKSFRGELLDN